MPGIGAMRLLGRTAIVGWARARRAGVSERTRQRATGPWRRSSACAGSTRTRTRYQNIQGLPYATTDLSASQPSMREEACGWGLTRTRSASSTRSGSPTWGAGQTPISARSTPRTSGASCGCGRHRRARPFQRRGRVRDLAAHGRYAEDRALRAGPDPQLPAARPGVAGVRGQPPTALPTAGSLFGG
jgi:hypothetical protein